MTARASVILASAMLVAALAACSRPPGAVPAQPRDLQVGRFGVRMLVPDDVRVVALGARCELHTGDGPVVIEDLGPFLAEAYRVELEAARALWRDGQGPDALAALADLSPAAIPAGDHVEHREFLAAWNGLLAALAERPPGSPEAAFTDVSRRLDQLPEPTTDELVERATAALFSDDERREIASRGAMEVAGLPAVSVDSWYRLSHDNASRVIVLPLRGRVLVFHGSFPGLRTTDSLVVGGVVAAIEHVEYQGARP